MIRIEDLTAKVAAYLPPGADTGPIGRAYVYAKLLHKNRTLPGGEPLLEHALEVSDVLAELRLDPACIVAGLLHHVLPEKLATPEELRPVVGDSVLELLRELAKIGRAAFLGTEESRADHMRQMILASTRDLRVILILLADRLQMMRALNEFAAQDRIAIARETLSIYSPIAHRLGVFAFLAELEDRAFFELEPETAGRLQRDVESRRHARREGLEAFGAELTRMLHQHGIPGEVIGRAKHLYSIYNKLRRNNASLDEIYDLLATRIIVERPDDCYRVLGLIHSAYTPLPGRFKDYIALPKPNGYQSLHTTVFGGHGDIFEIQIRSREMHRATELGVAAHFIYKDGGKPDTREMAQLAWFRRLLENLESGRDPKESMELLERDLTPEEIFVFTPAGEVIKLPARATPIDFAYAVHSDVGHRCVGAKMDGRMIPIRTPLHNGSVVQIITSGKAAPRKDWLKYAVTSKAVTRIRAYLRQRERAEAARMGRERCTREAKRFGRKLEELVRWEPFLTWMHRQGLHSLDELHAAEGLGKVSLRETLEKLLPDHAVDRPRPKRVRPKAPAAAPAGEGADVRVSGMRDLVVRFARCCSPKPGDPLQGIVTRGHAVSIHHRECGNVRRVRASAARLVEADWSGDGQAPAPIRLVVSAQSAAKGLSRVAELLEQEGAAIQSATITADGGRHVQRLTVQVSSGGQVQRILQRLNAMEGIRAVRELESA